ncbi:hypothetical protein [Kribbia dieselivorans]|uniref:hypothetical protein n=1 Tax=Kribbia dieselivorans TaxID=331526 RepID=UPI0008390F18|nr:hypothetical protein [Kribbia dieselivorans]
MPRANRNRRDHVPLNLERLRGLDARVTWSGRTWFVRQLSGASSTRAYRCPGCQQELLPGTPHVVVWPVDGLGGVDHRRHWHNSCWKARDQGRSGGGRM